MLQQPTSQPSAIDQESTHFLGSLNEATAPDGDTLQTREVSAREWLCVLRAEHLSVADDHNELTYRQAKLGTTLQSRDGPACSV